MGPLTLFLLGFMLGWIARHCVTTLSKVAHGFVQKLRGLKRVELDFHDDESPKLRE